MSGSQQTSLGKYQIIREIARSNDIVYEAYDPVMNRRVALKELALLGGSTDTQKEERMRRFVREAKAAGSLNHPNIVTIYECGEDSGRHYIAMEYLEGHTLRNEIDTHGFLAPEKALFISEEVLDALDYAHQSGVIHRDIKPENIQLLPDGRVKITDFGIARLTFEPNLTIDGQVFGTPSYMSPEQVVGREIDARSDLFSLGVVMYEMFAGQKPFTGDNVVAISMAIANATPVQPQQANHTVWQLISNALEKSPALRYATAADMKKAVEHAHQSLHSVVLDPVAPHSQVPFGQSPYGGQPFAPPIGNPYAGGTYPQPPLTYTFDPYQQQQLPGSQPSFPQGYPPLPIYYPPPPRPPLITVEAKAFMGRLFLTIVILGTLFGFVIVVIVAVNTLYERQKAQENDSKVRQSLDKSSRAAPVDTRIKNREETIGKLTDGVSVSEESRKLAADYEEKGQRFRQEGKLADAEYLFKVAQEKDPGNPDYNRNLGDLYWVQGQGETGDQRWTLWDRSAYYWWEAAKFEQNLDQKAKNRNDSATLYYHIATELIEAGNPSGARQRLYEARNVAEPGSQIAKDAEALLERMTG